MANYKVIGFVPEGADSLFIAGAFSKSQAYNTLMEKYPEAAAYVTRIEKMDDKPIVLINGTSDGQYPIEDFTVVYPQYLMGG